MQHLLVVVTWIVVNSERQPMVLPIDLDGCSYRFCGYSRSSVLGSS